MNLLTTGQVKAGLKKKWVTISRSPTFTMNQIGKYPEETVKLNF